jgi:hypothetical protein
MFYEVPSVVSVVWSYNFISDTIPKVNLEKANYVEGMIIHHFAVAKKFIELEYQKYVKNCRKEYLKDDAHVFNFLLYDLFY